MILLLSSLIPPPSWRQRFMLLHRIMSPSASLPQFMLLPKLCESILPFSIFHLIPWLKQPTLAHCQSRINPTQLSDYSNTPENWKQSTFARLQVSTQSLSVIKLQSRLNLIDLQAMLLSTAACCVTYYYYQGVPGYSLIQFMI